VRRIWAALPGTVTVKALQAVALAVVALTALIFLFEWAGTLLDSGGVVGPSS
jgi:hypothetical protein